MQIAMLGAALLLLVVWTVVGLRMLLLARRTGGIPELTLGLGLFTMAAIGYPLTVLSGLPGLSPETSFWIGATGTIAADIGLVSLYAFTWRVFRPQESWAALLFLVVVGLATLHLCGWLDASWGIADPLARLEAGRIWAILQLSLVGACMGWAGVESIHHWVMARRRLRLGLADPVVVNRFLLWGLMGCSAMATALLDTVLIAIAGDLALPAVAFLTSASGSADSIFLWLAFFPPKSYTSWITARAAT